MTKMFGILLTVLLLIFSLSTVTAQEVGVQMRISKTNIYEDDSITVYLTVNNNLDQVLIGTLHDYIPQFAVPIDRISTGEMAPSVDFDIEIPIGGTETFSYILGFSGIPIPLNGKRDILPGAVIVTEDNKTYYSNTIEVIYHVPNADDFECNFNGECETTRGENYDTCLTDCRSGINDNYCDGKLDLKCDPDCDFNSDPDCAEDLQNSLTWIFVLVIIIVAIVAVLILSTKRRHRKPAEIKRLKRM